MRRLAPLALALVLAVAAPARALDDPPVPEPRDRSGSVILPIGPQFELPRALYNAGVQTNLIAVIFKVPAAADGTTYTLRRTAGVGNLDAYFFAGTSSRIGQVCEPFPSQGIVDVIADEPEVGSICPGGETVAWGMVVLQWGVNAGFTLSW